jgi:carbamoyltransferase
MNVLGIALSVHDSAACLVRDGQVVAASEEERFTRIKHTGEFPLHAIAYCLKEGGITLEEVSHVAYSQVPRLGWGRRLAFTARHFPKTWSFIQKEVYWYLLAYGRLTTWSDTLGGVGRKARPFTEHFVEHHLAHTASAAFVSPFNEAAVCSIDQRGEWASTYLGVKRGSTITKLDEIFFPHSLGLFYLMITLYLGFNYHDEYQVMGLAAYGKPGYQDQLRRILRSSATNWRFTLDYRYISAHYRRLFSGLVEDELGPARSPDEGLSERHADIAASLQAVTEEAVFNLFGTLQADGSKGSLSGWGGGP